MASITTSGPSPPVNFCNLSCIGSVLLLMVSAAPAFLATASLRSSISNGDDAGAAEGRARDDPQADGAATQNGDGILRGHPAALYGVESHRQWLNHCKFT